MKIIFLRAIKMLKLSKYGLFLFLAVFAIVLPQGCARKEVVLEPFLSPKLLEQIGLEIVWQNQLPVKENENLDRLFLLGKRLYALSDLNYIVSFNREKGNIVFSRDFAKASLPVCGLELYNDMLISVIGSDLIEVNPDLGTEIRQNKLGFGINCFPARNQLYYYLAGTDKRLRVVRAADMVKLFEVSAENESTIIAVTATDEFAIFATDAGNVISLAAESRNRLWQFNASGGVVGPIVKNEKVLFFASRDTNLYKINIKTGRLVWKTQMAAMLDKSPVVTEDTVYQYVRNQGLVAVDKDSGKIIWQLPEGLELLARKGKNTYVVAKDGVLVVMDNIRAKKLYSVNLAGVSKYATNLSDSKIYIADRMGRIGCLQPIQ
jgi:outer membrane protein assembly factor BamB